jgi:N-acetylglucosaminyldiphosphoundecaprenol N-acetyl-beta-D-mannosaminyltransferase
MGDTKHPYRVGFLNAAFDNVDLAQVREVVAEHVRTRKPGYMVSLNTDIDIRLEKDPAFRSAHEDASLILMDSQPLFNLARRRGIPAKEKIAGSDLIGPACGWAAEKGLSIFILGGMPGVPERAAENLAREHPGLRVVGTLSPDYGFERDSGLLQDVISAVRDARPDLLFVCLGAPKSEIIVHEHLDEWDVPFSFCVGAAVDFAAGNIERAPRWMSDHGLEWFYRFTREPKRLFRRYFIDSWALLGIIRKYGKETAG